MGITVASPIWSIGLGIAWLWHSESALCFIIQRTSKRATCWHIGQCRNHFKESPVTPQTIVHCTYERHASAILDIFNEAILNSTALYDYKPRAPESMGPWFEAKKKGNFPVIGIEDQDGTLLAFGSYGSFRTWPAYKYTVEHSVYVHKDHRGHGLGLQVMQALIAVACQNEIHVMMGGIDVTNAGSIALHERLGFKHVGTLPQVGFKFGRWLDLSFYQLLLNTPVNPVDG